VRASFERLFRIDGPAVRGLPPLGLVGEAHCRRRPGTCDLSRGVLTNDRTGTVTLRLVRANPQLLLRLATPPFFVLPANLAAAPETAPPFPATGPYAVVRSTPQQIVLARNRYYRPWSQDAQPPGLPDRIVWRTGVSPAMALQQVRAGHADLLDATVPPARAVDLAARYPMQAHLVPQPAIYTVYLRTSGSLFASPELRQAVAWALNRARLARDVGPAKIYPRTCQILPVGMPGYRPYCPWSGPDLLRARRLVRDAGAIGRTVVVAPPADLAQRGVVDDVASALRRIGLRPRISSQRSNASAARQSQSPDLGLTGWIADGPYPNEFFDPTFTCAGAALPTAAGNLSRYCSRATDRMIARAERLSGGNSARAPTAWSAVDQRVTKTAAWIPYAGVRTVTLTSRRVADFAVNPLYGILLDQLSLHR